jgi:hypothetical protein
MGRRAVRDWTCARSVSEGIKSEVYVHLARRGNDDTLDQRIAAIEGRR